MSSANTAPKELRSLRVKLAGSVLALVALQNGRQIRARLNQLSVNGGLVSLEHPLDEGIPVHVVFHLGSTSIRCQARMMFPMWATQGCMQPFRFVDFPEQDHKSLKRELDALVTGGAAHDEEEN